MSAQQLANRAQLFEVLPAAGWTLRNVQAFDADLFFDAEVSARKRNAQCILELNISYENGYVAITAASFQAGRAEYVVYVDALESILPIVCRINADSSDLSVGNAAALANQLCEEFGNVYSFDGETSVAICGAPVTRRVM